MIKAGDFLDKIAFNGESPKAGDYIRAQRKILNFTLEDLENVTDIPLFTVYSPKTGGDQTKPDQKILDKKKASDSRGFYKFGTPKGIRTPVTAVKRRCPRPG
jgi:hypothetical protein